MKKRNVFFLSDGTGITAETLGNSFLTQFDNLIEFETLTIPFIKDSESANKALAEIVASNEKNGEPPIVFSTIIDPDVQKSVANCTGVLIDFFQPHMQTLINTLGVEPSRKIGRSHGLQNYHEYMIRIEAVDYALAYDDGICTKDYDKADLILIGVSRCGKTPTCLYLAMRYGLFVANYPITEEDLDTCELPKSLRNHKRKLFGLTIDPKRLSSIREERKSNSRYASMKQCEFEVKSVLQLFQRHNIGFVDTSQRSIEEIATELTALANVKRRMHV